MDVIADFLVIGSGVAALRAAIELGPIGDTVILTKAAASAGSTGYAQGGIAAAVGADDSPELHLRDTIAAGDGLVEREAAMALCERAPAAIHELVEWGAQFDRDGTGRLSLAREGAHRVRRVLHARDATGREIARVLWARLHDTPGIRVVEDACVTDAVVTDGDCVGVRFVTGDGDGCATAPATLLATGGAGYLFRETTNPAVATGDGIAIGYRAGADVTDIEFVQFHPTALAHGEGRRFLLSEALRGEGARLINGDGESFLSDAEGELGSRDRVARAIVREIRRTGGPVYLTFGGRDPAFVHDRFPLISERCRRLGLDLARDRIPVTPAAHYIMGGVRTDLRGGTRVPGLYAAGEVACTGVHGANRLASNSLLEGLVFGAEAARAMERHRSQRPTPRVAPSPVSSPVHAAPDEIVTSDDVRDLLWAHCGVFRDGSGLRTAHGQCRAWRAALDARGGTETIRNMVTVAELMTRAALRRKESRGAHHRDDFPRRNDIDWSRHTTLSKHEDST